MRRLSAGVLLVFAISLGGCDQIGFGGQPPRSTQLPSPQQLRSIRYMSQAAGRDGRRVFNRLEQAKSCHDFEIAMRWNRPPDLRGGPFNQKLTYVASRVPADLSKDSEVLIAGVIERGRALPSGSSSWLLKLKDGADIQAIETAGYAQKQEEAQESGGNATLVHPYTPGRVLCAYGVYQGNIGMADEHQHVPLVSVLFTMDRRR